MDENGIFVNTLMAALTKDPRVGKPLFGLSSNHDL
jgi:hypothetical protein